MSLDKYKVDIEKKREPLLNIVDNIWMFRNCDINDLYEKFKNDGVTKLEIEVIFKIYCLKRELKEKVYDYIGTPDNINPIKLRKLVDRICKNANSKARKLNELDEQTEKEKREEARNIDPNKPFLRIVTPKRNPRNHIEIMKVLNDIKKEEKLEKLKSNNNDKILEEY